MKNQPDPEEATPLVGTALEMSAYLLEGAVEITTLVIESLDG